MIEVILGAKVIMPVYETTEEAKSSSKPMIFYKVVEGKFVADGGSKITGIEGRFESTRVERDNGNEKSHVKPYDAIVCYISDEESVYRVKFHANIVFAGSFASQISKVNKGDTIRLSIRSGDKSPQVSFCDIKMQNENGEWVKVEWEALPTGEAERTQRVKEIVGLHPTAPKS
jgi:hypothetical protein